MFSFHRTLSNGRLCERFVVISDQMFGLLMVYQRIDEGISEDEAWRLFQQIVDALVHMSTLNILHRDIKLTNIFIGMLLVWTWFSTCLMLPRQMQRVTAKVLFVYFPAFFFWPAFLLSRRLRACDISLGGCRFFQSGSKWCRSWAWYDPWCVLCILFTLFAEPFFSIV